MLTAAAPRLASPVHAHLAPTTESCWCCGRPMAQTARRCRGCGVPAIVQSRPAAMPSPYPEARVPAWRDVLTREVAPSLAVVTIAVSSVLFTTLSVLSC